MTNKVTFTQVPNIWHRLSIIDEKMHRAFVDGDYKELDRLEKIYTQLNNETTGV